MSAEEKQVEVFGTKEVSVKEFMGSSDKSLVLLSDYAKAKENLHELKEKHQDRVEELVAIEKLTSDELKELNGIRAELREPRYLIQNIEKNNISVFESYKKNDKANLKGLIEINVALEDKATEKLKAEEERKKSEKELANKAEENRIAKIKSDIENIETYCLEVIQKITFDNVKASSGLIEQSLYAEYEFEEYDLLFDQVKDRVSNLLESKVKDVTDRENQRLENEAMKKEIFEVRVNRFKEIGFIIDNNDIFRSTELSHTYTKSELLDIDSATFERAIENIKKAKKEIEQAKRDAEIKKQKDDEFDIRKNRLFEIGFNITDNLLLMFCKEFPNISILTNKIFEASIREFEQILLDSKTSIKESKEQKEIADKKAKEAKELALKQKEEADQKAIADKKKADSENKARVKRLAYGKEFYESILNAELSRFPIMYDSDQPEIKEFSVECSNRISDLLKELLTKLNEL